MVLGDDKDICCNKFYKELIICKNMVDESAKLIKVLFFLKKTCGGFPNLCISLCIMLIIPITSARPECSFSKLKLINKYLRNSKSQQRLTGTLEIEHDISKKINYKTVIENFATQNSRKIDFT